MISMTGYGRAKGMVSGYEMDLQIKSVNHKYLDLSIKTPEQFHSFEYAIRNYLKCLIKRGKVEVSLEYLPFNDLNNPLNLEESLIVKYVNFFHEMEQKYGINNDLTATCILNHRKLFQNYTHQGLSENIEKELYALIDCAYKPFLDSKEFEGESIKLDLTKKLYQIKERVEEIKNILSQEHIIYFQRLRDKIVALVGDIDVPEDRIILEAGLLAQKYCVDEEIVRFGIHLDKSLTLLEENDLVGRKFDFLLQEMNREINTIGSKLQYIDVCFTIVEIKHDLEKIREQIQNIE